MKNVIGQPARGANFYKRESEVEKISNSLSNGNNIQITAPRRVGKTSILWYMLDNDVEKRNYIYVDTESISDEQKFYKKLLAEVLKNEKIQNSKKLQKKFAERANKYFQKLQSVNILGTGFELKEDKEERDYFEELSNFLVGYVQEESAELVILVDEFPQTIENIKKVSSDKAIHFLQRNRELRLNPNLKGGVKFIYTGSIGLNYTVSKLNATSSINDLNSIEIGPLNDSDARNFLRLLLESNNRIYSEKAAVKLLEKLQWYIPFHIQLVVQEIINQTKPNEEVTENTIEDSINKIIDLKNQNHFDHYHTRLKSQFKNASFDYADAVLKEIAKKGAMEKKRAFDLSVSLKIEADQRSIIETLMYDGYIYINPEGNYSFNSPIVRLWWLKFVC